MEAASAVSGEGLQARGIREVEETADAVPVGSTYVTGLVLDIDGGHMVRQYTTH